jgi:NAD-dependent dihydropyrimidine dehydrogenase PreA subunit
MKAGSDWNRTLAEGREMIARRFGIGHVTLQPEFCSDACGQCARSCETAVAD